MESQFFYTGVKLNGERSSQERGWSFESIHPDALYSTFKNRPVA